CGRSGGEGLSGRTNAIDDTSHFENDLSYAI
ncbi:hypothetical protein G4B88_014184, partial [Cannabis sativa]